MKSPAELASELRAGVKPGRPARRAFMTSTPVVAAIVFGVLALIASVSLLPLLSRFAAAATMSLLVVVAVPTLFAMLFALLLFLGGARGGWPMAVGRGLAVALATWPTFSAVAALNWCGAGSFLGCYGGVLLVTGFVGGGPILLSALIGGAIMAWLLRRDPLA